MLIKRAAGSLALSGQLLMERAALSVPVIDSVGAGDAFVAGFLAPYVQGHAVAGCPELATIAGAFACMGPGDWASMPRLEDLKLFEDNDPVTR